jgi:hypothetical protein
MSTTKDTRSVNRHASAVAAAALVICALIAGHADASDTPANVDAARMNKADGDAANWLSYGRIYGEQQIAWR